MARWQNILLGWAGRGRRQGDDIDEEIRFHIEQITEANVRAGMPLDEARRRATLRFGRVNTFAETCREIRAASFWDSLGADARHGLRLMRKSPLHTIVVVLTLALGIGANLAIFSVINALYFRPLPFPDGDRLVQLWENSPAPGQEDLEGVSRRTLTAWRADARSFEQLANYTFFLFNLADDGPPVAVNGAYVSANLFSLLRVAPLMGRGFAPAADQPGAPREVVISHRLWKTRFHQDAEVLGKTLRVNDLAHTVVGVMPAGFGFPLMPPRGMLLPSPHYEVCLPLGSSPFADPAGRGSMSAIGRLRDSATPAQAQAELAALTERLASGNRSAARPLQPVVRVLRDHLYGDARPAMLTLFWTVGFVLLIACGNLANLFMVRTSARSGEFFMRAALGAGRARLARQLLVESLLLAGAGGLAGLFLSFWLVSLLRSLSPGEILRVAPVGIDWTTAGCTLALSVVTGVLLGLAPAWRMSRRDLGTAPRERGSTGGVERGRLRNLLIGAEVALSLVLLVGAGLLVRSAIGLRQVDPGFQSGRLLTAFVMLPVNKYQQPRQWALFTDRVLEQTRQIPGVESAGTVSALPMTGLSFGMPFRIEGRPALTPRDLPQFHYRVASEGYFPAMGTTIRLGRDLTSADDATAPPVAVINETLARAHWPAGNAVGQRISFEVGTNGPIWREVVGVAADLRHAGPRVATHPEMFIPVKQQAMPYFNLVARTSAGGEEIAAALRRAVWAVDKDQPLHNIRPMADFVNSALAQQRFHTLLTATFAVTALLLALIGIYGVTSHGVSQRTREIGIRLALGAPVRACVRLVLWQSMRPVVIGLVVGVILSLALGRALKGLLFGVSAGDAVTYLVAIASLGGVAWLACLVPARRARAIQPIEALRGD